MTNDPKSLTQKARRTRVSLIAAGRKLIGQDGASGVTVMSVCALADVGRTSFYNYFEDVDALIRTVAVEAATEIKDRFDSLHADRSRGLARLRDCLEMILTLARDEPDMVLLLTALAATTSEIPALLEAEISAELAACDSIPPQEVPSLAGFLTITILALARHLAEGRMEGGQVSRSVDYMMRACDRN